VYQFQSVLTNKERQHVNGKIEISTTQLDQMLEEMNSIITSLILNYNVIDILSSDTSLLSYEWFTEFKSLQNLLQSIASNSDFNYQITILGADDKLYLSGNSYNYNLKFNSPLSKAILQGDGDAVLINRILDGYDENPMITYGRAVRSKGRFLGIILVDVTYTHLDRIFDLYPEDDMSLYVIQNNDKIVYSTASTVNTESVPMELKQALLSGASSVTMNNKEYLLMKKAVPREHITILALVNQTSVFEESTRVMQQFIIVFSLIIASTILGIIILTTHLSKNIRNLNSEVSKFGNEVGSLITAKVYSNDEVGQLTSGFIAMSKRITLLLEQIKESERNKRKLEYQALQAQVNPHMIYNTLNTITYLAQLQNIKNIQEVSSSFAGLLHLISNIEGEYLTIESEIEYIQAYISIKKYNLICNITTEYQIDDNVKDCTILKLLLQPIVENALVHGFANFTKDGLLTIRIRRQDSLLIIDIIDNGSGMEDQTVRQILNGQKKSKNSFTSIGIYNTLQRLRLQYGEQSVFQIISYPDVGTTVHIEYPLNSNSEKEVSL
jgi:sensor histidine kinase YesM